MDDARGKPHHTRTGRFASWMFSGGLAVGICLGCAGADEGSQPPAGAAKVAHSHRVLGSFPRATGAHPARGRGEEE